MTRVGRLSMCRLATLEGWLSDDRSLARDAVLFAISISL
jgi:hypothetical protein